MILVLTFRRQKVMHCIRASIVTILLLATAGPSAAETQDVVIALSDHPPAGTISPVDFYQFDAPPAINQRGEVAFLAAGDPSSSGGAVGPSSLWIHDGTKPVLIARRGQSLAAPGVPSDDVFEGFSDVVVGDTGAVAFRAATDSGADSMWMWTATGLSRVATTGSSSPYAFQGFPSAPALASDGEVTFFAARSTGRDRPYSSGIWTNHSNALAVIAEAGQAIDGMDDVLTFSAQSFGSPFSDHIVAASGGRTIFRGFAEEPSTGGIARQGLWTYSSTDRLRPFVLSGDLLPNSPAEEFVSFPQPPSMNDSGDLALLAFSRSTAASSDVGGNALAGLSLDLWAVHNGAMRSVVRVGEKVNGHEANGFADSENRFVDLGAPLINRKGDIVFRAAVGDPQAADFEESIWQADAEEQQLQLVTKRGMPAPATPAGVGFHSFFEPAMNGASQIAFMAMLASTSDTITPHNNIGLWAEDRTGELQLIARTGALLEVAPGDSRQIASLAFNTGSGGEDGRPRGINDRGQIAYRARFTDGTSAVLLSSVVAVPEPTTLILMLALLVVGWILRKCPRVRFGIVWMFVTSMHIASLASTAHSQTVDYLYPDLIPFVQEDQPYLQNWFIDDDVIRLQTVFANIGDGLLQLRIDPSGAGGNRTAVLQRVFIGIDNGAVHEDFATGRSFSSFHTDHGHVHFDDFSQFELLQVTTSGSGVLEVGPPISTQVKTSFLLHDSIRLPGPQWVDAPSFPSFNFGRSQNVSVGHGDVYSHFTEGQTISLDGVETDEFYWLRQTVDPSNLLQETDDANNSFEILIDLAESGSALKHGDGRFVQPGDFFALMLGDLNFDRQLTLDDWQLFRDGFGSPLDGLAVDAAYRLGDLNLDGIHSADDFVIFRRSYDAANGVGSFAALATGVPEPSTAILITILLSACMLHRYRW